MGQFFLHHKMKEKNVIGIRTGLDITYVAPITILIQLSRGSVGGSPAETGQRHPCESSLLQHQISYTKFPQLTVILQKVSTDTNWRPDT